MNRRFTTARRLHGLGILIAVAGAAACAMAPSFAADPPAIATVDISKFLFGPKEITVAPGTTVRWVNHEEVPHTVAAQDKAKGFASKALDTDDKFETTFTTEGDFNYICTVHPFMAGVVHVRKR
ncbi:MAG TPA: cupredoxin family copper-binding protein [Burkholderiaceae bacterium]|jgi:plastocyanin